MPNPPGFEDPSLPETLPLPCVLEQCTRSRSVTIELELPPDPPLHYVPPVLARVAVCGAKSNDEPWLPAILEVSPGWSMITAQHWPFLRAAIDRAFAEYKRRFGA